MKFEYDQSRPFWFNHAKAIIQINDLDPVYEAAHKSIPHLGVEKMNRFLVGMSLFYHIGHAAKLADMSTEDDFWKCLQDNYHGTPRGTERRYFRGAQGKVCLDYLQKHFSGPSDFIHRMYRPNYKDMVKAFQPVPAFGEYHIWKWLDFYERILGMPIDAEGCFQFVPKEPQKGAMIVAQQLGIKWEGDDKEMLARVMTLMINELRDDGVMAPPMRDRLIGISEVETSLCMHAHYVNGSDYVGKDLLDKHTALSNYGGMAVELKKNLPPLVDRGFFRVPKAVEESVMKKKKPKEENSVDLTGFWS